MNERDYRKLRKAIEQRLEYAKREYDEQLKALEKVWELARGDGSGARAPRPPKGAIRQAVLDVILEFTKPFGVQNVMQMLERQSPDIARATTFASLATVLRRLRDDGLIVIETAGSRSSPTLYRTERMRLGAGTQH